MKIDYLKTTAGATLFLVCAGVVSKGVGFIREILFASNFGLTIGYELFLIAAIIPTTINTISVFLVQNIYIPHYLKIKNSDILKARLFFHQNLILFFLFGLGLTLVLYIFSNFFLEIYLKNSNSNIFESTNKIFRIFLYTIPINLVISVFLAHLYAEKRFFLPTISQLFINVSIIILVVIFASKYGSITIAYGYLLGTFLQLFFLLVYIWSELIPNSFSLPTKSELKLFFSPILLTVLIETISQIHVIADRFFMNKIESGGIAALNYAMTLYILPISIITVSLSTAIFPSFTESIVNNNITELSNRVKKSIRFISLFFIPITLIYFMYGDFIVKTIFERGNFLKNDTYLTAQVLVIYAISLMFYSIYAVGYRIFFAASLVKHLFIIISLAAVLKIALNFLLVNSFFQNGLALSSTITYFFLFIVTVILLDKKLKLNLLIESFKNLIFYLICIIFSYFISFTVKEAININYIKIPSEIILLLVVFLINIVITDKRCYHELISTIKIHNLS